MDQNISVMVHLADVQKYTFHNSISIDRGHKAYVDRYINSSRSMMKTRD